VWLYPSDNALPLSIGFGKRDGLISVAVRHDSGQCIMAPTLHGGVRAAFTLLWEAFGMLQVRRERRKRQRHLIQAWAGFAMIAAFALAAMWGRTASSLR
jgi:hypothetical protein